MHTDFPEDDDQSHKQVLTDCIAETTCECTQHDYVHHSHCVYHLEQVYIGTQRLYMQESATLYSYTII